MYTAVSRKVVGKKVHATIPKGDMRYDQYTVPDTITKCRTHFCCFPLALANVRPWPLVIFYSGLSRALFPTTFLEIAVYENNIILFNLGE